MSLKNYFHSRKRSKKGFTLVEMVLAVGILAIVSGATLYLVFGIQQSARNAGTITSEQYTGTQIERFLRNELQTAREMEKTELTSIGSTSSNANAEYIYFDTDTNQLKFMKAGITGTTYESYFSVDNVESVTLTFKTLDTSGSAAYVKLEYSIVTETYTYEGGIVIGNSDSSKDFGGVYDA
ncbi:MAG: type II secretion system GspH family protein, partial [Clostridia bacterium]|nr:type II secretion system GspH family protein [Clostridia bacterium]